MNLRTKSTTPWLAIFALLIIAVAGVGQAVTSLKIAVAPGSTVIPFDGSEVLVETTESVVVYLSRAGDQIVGTVAPASDVRASDVRIVVLGPPDNVIFEGRITGPIDLNDYIFTEEVGRGEQ